MNPGAGGLAKTAEGILSGKAGQTVSAIGGKSGYGKGEHAGVSGQGPVSFPSNTQGVDVDEGLTKDEVGRVIHAHIAEIRYCYESEMIKNPTLEGKLAREIFQSPLKGA